MGVKLTNKEIESIIYGSNEDYTLVCRLDTIDDGYLGTTPFIFKDKEGRLYKDGITYDEFGDVVYEANYYGNGVIPEVEKTEKTVESYEIKESNNI